MRILNRYLSRHLLLPILMSAFMLVFLILIADVLDHLSEMMRNDTPLKIVLEYYVNLIPFSLGQILPWATLLGSMFILVTLASNNEIVAMKACGLSPWIILRPFLIVGLSLGLLHFLVNDQLVPLTYRKAQAILEDQIEAASNLVGKAAPRKIHNLTYFSSGNRLYYAEQLNLDAKEMDGLIILYFNENKISRRKIFAQKAKWISGTWKFYNVTDYDTNSAGKILGNPRVYSERSYSDISESPSVLASSSDESFALTFWGLKDYIERLEGNGIKAYAERVALHSKLATPWQSVIIIMIVFPLLSAVQKRKMLAFKILLSILAVFCFHVLSATFIAMGKAGTLPPVISAWSATALFGLVPFYLINKQ